MRLKAIGQISAEEPPSFAGSLTAPQKHSNL